MVDFGIYLLELSICLAAFHIIYMLFLARDTFAARNRFYLLFSIVVSMLIPFLSFSITDSAAIVANQFVWELEQSIESGMNLVNVKNSGSQSFSFFTFLFSVYLIGVLFSFIRLFLHALHLVKSIKANEIENINGLKIVSVNEKSSPYSFFGYVFLNKEVIPLSEQKNVLLHESIHAKQYHSIDLLLIEFVKMLLWFNPFIYLVKRSLVEMHEYLADRECLKEGVDKIQYQNALLRTVEGQMMYALTSSFNSSLTLKRIKMIKKINTSSLAHLKLILVLPVILLSLLSFSFRNNPKEFYVGNFEGYYPNEEFSFPLESGDKIYITSEYGERFHPIKKKKIFHRGVDIAAPLGTPIHAIADGTVSKVNLSFKNGKGYGRFVIVDHQNGFGSLYSQMDSYVVKEGQKVKKGDVLGAIGSSGMSTGPHLHFELKKDGKNVNPLDYFKMDLSAYRK